MLSKIVIWGTSGHARVVADIVRSAGRYELVGFVDDINRHRHGTVVCGATVLGGREVVQQLVQRGVAFALGFGNNPARRRLGRELQDSAAILATLVHPRSVIAADCEIGPGTVVIAGAVINSESRLGASCIVNTAATIDHDCVIGEGVHISPGAHLAGGVTVEDEAWVGIGAVVVPRRTIGMRSIIGAGAVVTEDIPPGVVAYGVPARVVRAVREDD